MTTPSSRLSTVSSTSMKSAAEQPSRRFRGTSGTSAPLALFSSTVSEDVKEAMVLVLRATKPLDSPCRSGNGFGRPRMPVIPSPNGPANAVLSTFVGQDSWQFFAILGIDSGFVDVPVSEWSTDERWQYGKRVVNHLSVTNDAAERGVKLAHDYLNLAKKERAY